MRSFTLTDGFESIVRRLSRYAPRFLSFASVSTTFDVLSSVCVVCWTIFPCFSACKNILGKSCGATRMVIVPDADKSRVRAVRFEEVTSHWMVAQYLIIDSQDFGRSASVESTEIW